MRKIPLTEKQQYLFNFLVSFFKQNDQIPPAEVIKDHFGWSSANAAYEMMICLEKEDILKGILLVSGCFAGMNDEKRR